mgnify:CR=1 FL=1
MATLTIAAALSFSVFLGSPSASVADTTASATKNYDGFAEYAKENKMEQTLRKLETTNEEQLLYMRPSNVRTLDHLKVAGLLNVLFVLSVTGWARHGVLWEGTELGTDDYSFEPRFIEANRDEEWSGPHVLEYVTHTPGSPHAGRRVWPKV